MGRPLASCVHSLPLAAALLSAALPACSTEYKLYLSVDVQAPSSVSRDEVKVEILVGASAEDSPCMNMDMYGEGDSCTRPVDIEEVQFGPVGHAETLRFEEDPSFTTVVGYEGGDYELIVVAEGQTFRHVRTLPTYHRVTFEPDPPVAGHPLRVLWGLQQPEMDCGVSLYLQHVTGSETLFHARATTDPGSVEIPPSAFASPAEYHLGVTRMIEEPRKEDGTLWGIKAVVSRNRRFTVE